MGNNSSIPNENTLKITHSNRNQNLAFVCMEMKGWRKEMQDTAIYELEVEKGRSHPNSFFAVFDGHGTTYISHFVKQKFVETLVDLDSYKKGDYAEALEDTFRILDSLMLSEPGQEILAKIKNRYDEKCEHSNHQPTGEKLGYLCGCTANVVLITEDHYYVANCGDSRSVLCRDGYGMNMSKDHKPENPKELERIERAGGFVERGRVNDMLAVSRALGDFEFKKNPDLEYDEQMVTCKPDIEVFGRTKRDEFILIACDGIWENFPKSSLVIEEIRSDRAYAKGDYCGALENLFNKLIAPSERHSFGMDNMTALFVKLNQGRVEP